MNDAERMSKPVTETEVEHQFDELDVDMYATVTFEDPTAQGFGLYARQNGGALQDTNPPGLGYALYIEGAYMRAIGYSVV